jgi:formate dehydrogenase iron-sulfur subunit
MEDFKVTRRGFLTRVGSGAVLASAACLVDGQVAPIYASGGGAARGWAVLIDLTRCTGCGSCFHACSQSNGLAAAPGIPSQLDHDAYTCLQAHQVSAANGAPQTVYVKRQCMHCLHPACVSACTLGALRQTPQGAVVYDAGKCFGCRYCQYACPFGVPTYDWGDPLGLIHKCQFCYARLSAGLEPACAAACPTGALHFGEREGLLAHAYAKIASNAGRYVAHVYGENEAGGTAMLYLSAVPFAELDFPALDAQPVPRYAEAVMKRTPIIAVTVASAITGLNWVLKRRDQGLAHIQGEDK